MKHIVWRVFLNTDIKGGIAISYRDNNRNFGAIDTFSIHTRNLTVILRKIRNHIKGLIV